jgi:prepilin-type N-terminal cleavage/methylation domain-containing protein
MNRPMRSFRAFTLIELLVVIAIIGVLATMAVVSFGSARVKARDAKRAYEMKEIAKAVEMYYDEYSHYPIPVTTWTSFDAPSYKDVDITNPAAADITTALRPWLPGGAADPKRTSANDSGYLYRQGNSGADFCILIWRTPENMNNFPLEMVAMNRCGSIGANGQCSGTNAIFFGTAAFAAGC